METTVNGKRVRYECRGEAHGAETVALFLHGWGASGGSFGRLLDLVGERFLVLAPDLPGFGGSEEPETAWNVDGFCEFALEFLRFWQPKTVLLFGHSYGGRMCIKLASRKSLPFSIAKIVLFDAAGILPRRSLGYRLKVSSYKLGKAFLSLAPVRAAFPHALDEFRAGRGSADYNAASPVMRACLVQAVNEDLAPCLPNITAPTLLIWGENDTATPLSDGERMEREIPDAGLVRVPGAGHFSFLDNPALCQAAVRSFVLPPSDSIQ